MTVLDGLYTGKTTVAFILSDGSEALQMDVSQRVVLAGSFNPLHNGHRGLLAAAEKITGREGMFEISIKNVDKPDLPPEVVRGRVQQFRDYADVAVTSAQLFSAKAAILPGAWFVIGYDTAVRLLDDAYYPDRDAIADLKQTRDGGSKFIVAGRVGADGVFRCVDDLNIHNEVADMFIPIPESEFRSDISSTELRARDSE